ncbi:E3 ubiquitin-protein ligase TRIM36-like [Saccostrea echinata]|uniref:E3 ubiquitin-protein ligase TRIM36-like n=1 Tax=Saccostrea echinata TaxID=191078 RepID=UPI002A821959|nr:E3 ubiquitin-protein ligase TRIM36-like [Saccostrea echinata]XP_061182165.1 E3 ubiquitin-protein ligase TRIM36-like [Saccostrea echinata]
MAESKPRIPGTAQHFLECGIKDCERNCEFYCNPCHQQMCKQCRDEHLRSPETKSHEVVLYQQWKRQLPVKKCKIHPTKDIDLLCEECKIPLCSKCAATQEHKGHTFTDLETIYEDKFSLCLKEIAKTREYFLPTSQDIQKNIEEDATEIKKIMNNLRTSMKAEAESLKSLVDEVVSENMKQLDQIEYSLLDDLKNQDKAFSDYIAYLNNLIKEFQEFLSSPDPTKLTLTLSLVGMEIRPIPETTKPVSPVFTAGQYRKDDVVKLLGKISSPEIKPETRKIKPMEIPSLLTPKTSTSKHLKSDKRKFNLKQTLSLSSSVTKVTKLDVPGVDRVVHMSQDQSGRLWVSDSQGNLVQTDLQGNVIQRIETSGEFGYHTVTQDGDLIFIDYKKKVINRITMDNNITEFIKIGDWEPLGMHSSHINGDILVGMMKGVKGKVTRYNKTGTELQNIQRDNEGQELYSTPIYITENINGDICTSEFAKGVVVVNKSGQYRFSYTGQGSVFRPYGICTDVLGHILVCDSYNVHLLDQDGQFLSLLLTQQQVSSPVSVCVDDENNLYVGALNAKIIMYKYLQ